MYMRGTDSTDQSAYTQVMNSGGTDWPAYIYPGIYIYIPASVFPDLCSDDTDQPLYTKMYACIMVQTSLHITKYMWTVVIQTSLHIPRYMWINVVDQPAYT